MLRKADIKAIRVRGDSELYHAASIPLAVPLIPPTATLSVPPTATLSVPPTATLSVPPTATLSVPPTATLSVPPTVTLSMPLTVILSAAKNLDDVATAFAPKYALRHQVSAHSAE